MRRLTLSILMFLVVCGSSSAGYPPVRSPQDAGPENLQVLAGAATEQLRAIMQATAASLGVECVHCHVAGQFASDELEAKQTARAMMRMLRDLGSDAFELLETPSCWTCHRGAVSPERSDPDLLVSTPVSVPAGAFSASADPSAEVYGNVVLFGELPAAELAGVMSGFSRALGVGCDHCHVPGDWASDERIEKQLSRVMVGIERSINTDYLPDREPVTCWTCHRGEAAPELSLPPGLMPAPIR